MRVIQQRFSVAFEYPVAFTRGVFNSENPTLVECLTRLEPARQHRMLVVIDRGVDEAHPHLRAALDGYVTHHRARLQLAGPPVVVAGGEAAKNDPHVVQELQRLLFTQRIDRQSFLVGVGGGAVLDAVGYAAATTHRGVRMVRLPTTVLAQNDAGVGVKSGVNAFGIKNFLGAFQPPFAVIDDFDFLSTLSRRDVVAGFAEAIKVALLRDSEFFRWMENSAPALHAREPQAVATLVQRCAELHLQHIAGSGDPFERGNAKPLDFGHWAAHKLETLTGHALRHGEAVAIGLLLDCRYAILAGLLPAKAGDRVERLVAQLGLPRFHPALLRREGGRQAVLAGLREFQEHVGGDLAITLLRDIGAPVEVAALDEHLIGQAIADLERRDAGQAAELVG